MTLLENIVLFAMEKKDIAKLPKKNDKTLPGFVREVVREKLQSLYEADKLTIREVYSPEMNNIADIVITDADANGLARFRLRINKAVTEERIALYWGVNYEHSSFKQYKGEEMAARQSEIGNRVTRYLAKEMADVFLALRVPFQVYFFSRQDLIGTDERTKEFY